MTTTVQNIVDRAVARSMLNDEQKTRVTSDIVAIVGHMNDVIAQLYADAGAPVEEKLRERNDYLAVTEVVQITTAGVYSNLANRYAHLPEFSTGSPAVRVGVIEPRAAEEGIGELPPCIIFNAQSNTVQQIATGGRPGDPLPGQPITVRGTPLPVPMTQASDYLGSTILQNPNTTSWTAFNWLADPFMVHDLALWFAIRGGDRDAAGTQTLQGDRKVAYDDLIRFLRKKY